MIEVSVIIAGIKRDDREQEYFPVSSFGFKVFEFYNDGTMSTYNNVTEIHWRYAQKQRAYESDIHNTGSCWEIKRHDKHVVALIAVEMDCKSSEFKD